MSEQERSGRQGPDGPDGPPDEPTRVESADAEPACSEPTDAEPVCSEPMSAEPTGPDATEREATVPESAGPDEADWPDRLLRDLNNLNNLNDPTGNAMLNNGPDTPGADELALRRMMRSAVQELQELEPSDRALEHLRKAVPARRVRRRQAIVGMAAAALFVGTAIPAFVHVAKSDGTADERPAVAGHGQDTRGGTGGQTRTPDGKEGESRPSGKPTSKDKSEKPDQGKDPHKNSPGAGTSAGGMGDIGSSGTVPVSSPTCEPSQLGVSAGTGAPDADGKVYGTFRIANVSGQDCAVAGTGSVNFQALGAADSGRIDVVEHTSNDAAVGLPDPSQEATGLVLAPDMAYEVKFAWVPTGSCPTTTPSPTPSPTDGSGGTASEGTGNGNGGAGSGDSGQTGAETQLGEGDGPTEDGSIAVTHTPESGEPGAAANIPNACAGTIYRTGVLEAS
ncbi:hypothetical protein ABCR94_02325 [Streptomyces sp. 21So2-11]|uniref:hypothetical protein n=1 Tax=Streptomyces sp. 21So2-11 TaxID=3144408 RepID=UPI00321BA073